MVLDEALLLLILRYAEEEADGSRSIREPTFHDLPVCPFRATSRKTS